MNWLIYQYLMIPLIRRAPDQDVLDADVVLVTFGLLFVFQGLALVNWSGDLRGYSFLSSPVHLLGATVALNRLLAFLGACALALALFLVLRHTRFGAALRAITIDPVAASLVGVDVRKYLRARVRRRRRAGRRIRHAGLHLHLLQRHHRRRIHPEGADRRDHGRRRPRHRHARRRAAARRRGVGSAATWSIRR